MENKEDIIAKWKHILDKLDVPEHKRAILAEYAEKHQQFELLNRVDHIEGVVLNTSENDIKQKREL